MINLLEGLVLLIVAELVSSQVTSPTVQTTEGQVQGTIKEYNGTKVYAYLGIPYAKPPVGKLRLRLPQLPPVRSQIYVADKPGPKCLQDIPFTFIYTPGSDEDCLYLDILVPANRAKGELLNVVLFIFGGGFNFLSPQFFSADSPVFPATQNVISVNFDYRQDLFGFAYHEKFKEQFFGNIGFYDQVMAIRWVQKNIRNFGGNPDTITLWGESAGAIAISGLLFSPYAENLKFKRAIITSGSGFLPQNMPSTRTTMSTQAILDRTGCILFSDKISCLQKFNATHLTTLFPTKFLTFLPTFETQFLPVKQYEVFLDPKYPPRDIDLMIGICSQDGSAFDLVKSPEIFLDPLLSHTGAMINIAGIYEPDTVAKAFKWYILDFGYTTPDKIRRGLINIVTDIFVGCTSWEMSRRLLKTFKKSNIYAYVVAKKPTKEPLFFCDGVNKLGVCHSDDLVFAFGLPYKTPELYTDSDREESAQIMRSYSTFAKTGMPALPFSNSLPWPKFGEYSKGKIRFPIVIIDSDNPGDIDNTYAKFCYRNFIPNVKNLIPKLLFTDRFESAIQAPIDAIH